MSPIKKHKEKRIRKMETATLWTIVQYDHKDTPPRCPNRQWDRAR